MEDVGRDITRCPPHASTKRLRLLNPTISNVWRAAPVLTRGGSGHVSTRPAKNDRMQSSAHMEGATGIEGTESAMSVALAEEQVVRAKTWWCPKP